MRDLPAHGEPNHGRRLVDIVAPQASFLRTALERAWRMAPAAMRMQFLQEVLTAEERVALAETPHDKMEEPS
jgi:hypothetical protein